MVWRDWVPARAGAPPSAKRTGDQTPAVYGQRNYRWTDIGYLSAPVFTHPDDLYTRVPAAPTFDRVWQGFQKVNPTAALAVASRHPGMGPIVPGAMPWSPYTGNTQALQAARVDHMNKDPGPLGLIGPGTPWIPNPTNPNGVGVPVSSRPSLASTIRSRLGF